MSRPAIQRAKAAVAVRHERAHAERLGQGEGLAVVGRSLARLRGIAMRCNVAEEVQGIRLVAPFLVLTGKRQRLLEGPHGLAVGRLPQGLLPCLPAVRQGLVPYLTVQSMVRQALDLFGQAVRREAFEGLYDVGMEYTPSLLKQTAIGHLVRQGVLEGVGAFWEQARFVEEFGGLHVREATMQRLCGDVGNGLHEG